MPEYRYILFNKPYGVLSQFTDEGTGHPTLKEYIPVKDVYAAGRLDRDSEGLLLLTNDGVLIKQLTDPRHHVEKTYLVQVEGVPTPEKLAQLEKGVVIQGYQTLPCKAREVPDPELSPRLKPVTPHGPTAWVEVKLREGKNRQVRHMTASVGLFTLRLLRIAIGGIGIGNLAQGKWRDLTPQEVRSLRK